MKTVLFEVTGSVARITLNRPEMFNALNGLMGEELAQSVKKCFAPEIRAVVLTGAGRAFCSGGDLKAMQEAGREKLPQLLSDLTKLFHRVIMDIRLLPKPVIAAVNGSLGGGGFSLALACDLRFAAEQARFKQAYTSAALCPDGGFTAFLPVMVGLAKASELLFLDSVLDARQAAELGIVNEVFSEDEFRERVATIASNLAAGPTQSFARVKALLNQSLLTQLERQLELERQGMIAASRTEDAYEGIAAFFEKRPPAYQGK